jgi:NAD(P)-dependent dehydrogenase (short-subunit alcohol dehydrogenase family)
MADFDSLFSVKGKTALVTGGSSGLGVIFAEALAAAGADVIVAARRLDKLEGVRTKLMEYGAKALAIACDVSDFGQVKALVEKSWSAFGRVDIVVNNAGIAAEAGIVPEKVPADLFEQTTRVNLVGCWFVCREVGARMLADGRGGSIINIASIAGLGGQADFPSAYQATKGALITLTQHLATSWADRGVRVNALAPAWFESELTAVLLHMDEFKKWAESNTPMGRIGEPRDLAGPLLFLASDASSYVTGQILAVDGGNAAGVGAPRFPAAYYRLIEEKVPDGLGQRIRRK